MSVRAVNIIIVSVILLALAACGSNLTGEIGKNGNMSSTTAPTGPFHYVALGDSTGAGVGARDGGYVLRLFNLLRKQRVNSTLTNLCVSGATTGDLLRGQLERGVGASPQLVTVGIGINDVGHGIELERFTSNYATMLDRLKKETNAIIVITNLPDVSSSPVIPQSLRAGYQQKIRQFNDRIQDLARAHGIVVFDVYRITHEELPNHPEYFSADGFHPSDAGYQLWADEMWPVVAKEVGVNP